MAGSALWASIVSGMTVLAVVLLGIPAGRWADRHRPVRLIQLSTLIGAVGTGAIIGGHLAFGTAPLLVLVVAAFLLGVATAVFSPAERALLKDIVPGDRLGEAMAMNQTRYAIGVVGGPMIGAFLFALSRVSTFVFDLFTYLWALVLFSRIRAAPETTKGEVAGVSFRDTLRLL